MSSFNHSMTSNHHLDLHPPTSLNDGMTNFYYPSYPNTSPTTDLTKFDKDLIYNHPLFPLLTLIFDKCELATNSPRDGTNPNYACSSASLNEDLIEFTKQLAKEHRPCHTSNPEIDNLMLHAIQVLRFHLLELEKVHELCDNFCQRYIQLLKGKMPMDIILDERELNFSKSEDEQSEMSNHDYDHDVKPLRSLSQTSSSNHDLNQTLKSTSDSSESHSPHQQQQQQQQQAHQPVAPVSVPASTDETDKSSENFESSIEGDYYEENDDHVGNKRRQKKRGIFPKAATSLMRAWLFQHLNHPYPSEEQKKILARETNLNILQVNNWFINARRRIVQPMIDQSNRAAIHQKAVMPTEYNDLMTNNPYHSFDPTRTAPMPTPYAFAPTSFSPYDEISAGSAYCPAPAPPPPPPHPSAYTTNCPPLHPSSFFAAAAAAAAAAAVGTGNVSSYQRHDDGHVE